MDDLHQRITRKTSDGTRGETGAYFKPKSPMEVLIAEIWEEAMGINDIRVYDNFFDLGGHSILAARVISRLRAAKSIHSNPKELVFQTLGQYARTCEERLESQPEKRRTIRNLVNFLKKGR